jgi:hypothetical protein
MFCFALAGFTNGVLTLAIEDIQQELCLAASYAVHVIFLTWVNLKRIAFRNYPRSIALLSIVPFINWGLAFYLALFRDKAA